MFIYLDIHILYTYILYIIHIYYYIYIIHLIYTFIYNYENNVPSRLLPQ